MNTLAMSQTLMNAGLERKPAEAIATIIDEKNQETATKKDLKLFATVIIGFVAAGFGYVVSLLNTIIGVLPSVVN
jgi:vacuolar-type H+-ATPase subunit I/STV1